MRKLLKKQGFVPKLLVTDKLRSYACAPASTTNLPAVRLTFTHAVSPKRSARSRRWLAANRLLIKAGVKSRHTMRQPVSSIQSRRRTPARYGASLPAQGYLKKDEISDRHAADAAATWGSHPRKSRFFRAASKASNTGI
jgi:hypothetical protein